MKPGGEIKKEIIDELKKHPLLASSAITADVICGNVFLSGKVDSYRKKYEAGKLIRSMDVVKNVHLDLDIELPPGAKKPDAAIRDAIWNFLLLNSSIPENKISISVSGGVVVLTGEAENEPKNIRAMNTVMDMPGILNLWNFIKVKTATTNNKQRVKVIDDKKIRINTYKLLAEDLIAV